MSRGFISIGLAVLLFLLPTIGYSVIFLKIGDDGARFYACEGASGQPIRIKQIEKNKFTVLSRYLGKTVVAENEFKVAQIVCGEIESSQPPPK